MWMKSHCFATDASKVMEHLMLKYRNTWKRFHYTHTHYFKLQRTPLMAFLQVYWGSTRSSFLQVIPLRRNQISQIHTSPTVTVSTFIITMRMFPSYQFPAFFCSLVHQMHANANTSLIANNLFPRLLGSTPSLSTISKHIYLLNLFRKQQIRTKNIMHDAQNPIFTAQYKTRDLRRWFSRKIVVSKFGFGSWCTRASKQLSLASGSARP